MENVKKYKQTWKEKKLIFQRWKMQAFLQQERIQKAFCQRIHLHLFRQCKFNKYNVNIGMKTGVLVLCHAIFRISFKARKVQDKTTEAILHKGRWEVKHWTAQSSSAQHPISCWTPCSCLLPGLHQQLHSKIPWQKPHFEKCVESTT